MTRGVKPKEEANVGDKKGEKLRVTKDKNKSFYELNSLETILCFTA